VFGDPPPPGGHRDHSGNPVHGPRTTPVIPSIWPRWVRWLIPFLLLSACGPSREELKRLADRHPTRELAYWGKAWQEQPLAERVYPAPAALLEKISIENRMMDISSEPAPMAADPLFTRVIKRVEALLPEVLQRLARERIVGLYLVRNLGSTGYTEAIRNEAGQEAYAVIVLDGELLQKKTANQWATWRERSFFKERKERQIELTVHVAPAREDTAESAAFQILLHELGHALGMASHVHPSWNEPPIASEAFPFLQLSWQGQAGAFQSRYDRTFLQRRHLRLYAFEKASLH
jgi:hypothetical protein